MAMPTNQELEQQLLRCRSIGIGLTATFTSLIVEHAKLIGGDPDAALIRTRQILDESLKTLSAKGTAPTGAKIDASPDIQRRVTMMLNQAEQAARRLLGLPPGSRSAH